MQIALFILNFSLSAISGFFIIAATVVFLHCFYDPGFIWHKKKAVLAALYVLLNTVLLLLPYSNLWLSFGLIGEMIIAPGIVVYDYSGNRLRGALRYLWVYYLIGICATIITDVSSQYIFPDSNWLIMDATWEQALLVTSLYTVIFSFIFFYLYYRIYRKNIILPWTRRERIFVAVYTIACVVLAFLIDSFGKNGKLPLIILGSCFILTAILVPVFFYYLRISEYFQNRTKSQEAYMQAELVHFQQYKQTQEETARFRHDSRNNLLCLNELLSAGKHQEASAYVQSLLQVTDTLRPKFVTGDEILDSILAVKSEVMEINDITFRLDGVLAGGLPWQPVDVCNVFANALDNAIEACLRLPQEARCIAMTIKATPQFWLVKIENPVSEDVDIGRLFKKTGGYTSKKQGMHGMGTYSIKHTVEAYDGILKATCANKQFRLEIMIPKNKEL